MTRETFLIHMPIKPRFALGLAVILLTMYYYIDRRWGTNLRYPIKPTNRPMTVLTNVSARRTTRRPDKILQTEYARKE
jgi:hypothetical protein